jgi:(2Fe-2S) ferredoxin
VNDRGGSLASCGGRGSRALADKLEELAQGRVQVRRRPCMGFCEFGPNIRREGTGVHVGVTEADLPGIIDGTKKSNIGSVQHAPSVDETTE